MVPLREKSASHCASGYAAADRRARRRGRAGQAGSHGHAALDLRPLVSAHPPSPPLPPRTRLRAPASHTPGAAPGTRVAWDTGARALAGASETRVPMPQSAPRVPRPARRLRGVPAAHCRELCSLINAVLRARPAGPSPRSQYCRRSPQPPFSVFPRPPPAWIPGRGGAGGEEAVRVLHPEPNTPPPNSPPPTTHPHRRRRTPAHCEPPRTAGRAL